MNSLRVSHRYRWLTVLCAFLTSFFFVFLFFFFREHPSVQAMSEQEVIDFRTKHAMNLQGHGIPKPVRSFVEASFPDYLLNELKAAGFSEPTAIQVR